MSYRICKRCIMDTSDHNIKFDEKGYCNHCNDALKSKEYSFFEGEVGEKKFKEMISKLKEAGKGKKYDCVVGISGGIDSSYLAYLLSKENVRMLGVHIDAGWNTDISSENIKTLCEKCNIDLKVITIDKKEMMDLQRAYFLSEVVNQDIPQDHAFFAMLYKFTTQNNIDYFISGHNWVSESITPISWGYDSQDSINLKDIHKKYGRVPLKTFPIMSFFDVNFKYPYLNKLNIERPLNYVKYDPAEAFEILNKEVGFKYYGAKHCESVFTRLYQCLIQPEKFGFEKRRAHLSSMVVSGLISREEALKEMEQPVCTKEQIEADINAFIKEIDITREEFDKIMAKKGFRTHLEFKTDKKLYNIKNKMKKIVGK
ncbi:MAG: N-acetyl sugar amidotransferase [Clostridium sp.]|nr:N-acetyl sugar amidotransferase [Clostridium sp.]